MSDVEFDDDERFREALIRDAEIRETENVNERIEAIWLKKNVFVYKQRASRFEMFRFENQKNQKFDRSFVNFRSFDFDCLDSNNLSTLRRFDDFFARNALSVNDCEIFAEKEHCNQLAFEFRCWWSELWDDIDKNDYLTILFFYLLHHCLSIRMCWDSHEMLHEDVCDDDINEDHDEDDVEIDDEKIKTWFQWRWFWFW